MIGIAVAVLGIYALVSALYVVALSRRVAHLEELTMKGGLEVELPQDIAQDAHLRRVGR